jgi:hypothetical protein
LLHAGLENCDDLETLDAWYRSDDGRFSLRQNQLEGGADAKVELAGKTAADCNDAGAGEIIEAAGDNVVGV